MKSRCLLLLLMQILLVRPATAQRTPEFWSPGERSLVVRGDTVWFVNQWPFGETIGRRPAIAFVTSNKSWVEARIPLSWAELPEWLPADPNDTTVRVVFRSGHRLVHVGDTVVQMADNFPSPVYAVRDPRTRRETRVLIREKSPLDYGDYGTEISAYYDEGDVVWFGMWAGAPSVHDVAEFRQRSVPEWIGGMVRYDVATGNITPVLHRLLQTNLIQSIQRSGDALWIALVKADLISGNDTAASLVRYHPRSDSWTAYRNDTSPFPGAFVEEMMVVGDLLFMATDSGAAVLNTRTTEWFVRWNDHIVRSDSIIDTYTAARPATDRIRDAAIAAAGLLDEPRISALLLAARRAPREPLIDFVHCLSQCDDGFDLQPAILASAALAQPVFLPFLADALSRDRTDEIGNPWWIAIQALVRIGDSTSVALLRAQLADKSTARASAAASELVTIHDPVGRAWMLERLRTPDQLSTADLETLVDAAGEAMDSATVPALFSIALSRMDTLAMAAALKIATLEQNRGFARNIEGKPALWYGFLDQFTERRWAGEPPAHAQLMEDLEIRASVLRIARTSLLRADTALVRTGIPGDWQLAGLHTNAVTILSRWGTRSDIGVLARLFGDSSVKPFELAYALVRLTGVEAAPRVDRHDATATEISTSVEFWKKWLATDGQAFQLPGLATREEALLRWLLRHNLPICC